jgi:hypothetical protein
MTNKSSKTKTRTLATNNLMTLNSGMTLELLRKVREEYNTQLDADIDYGFDHYTPAMISNNNRATVIDVSYMPYVNPEDDSITPDALYLIPSRVRVTYQADKMDEADKRELMGYKAKIKPLNDLTNMGKISVEQFNDMASALIDMNRYNELLDMAELGHDVRSIDIHLGVIIPQDQLLELMDEILEEHNC